MGEGVPVESEPTAACRDDRETVSTMQTLGVVGLVAGGALAVGSVVLLVTAPGRASGSERSEGEAYCTLRLQAMDTSGPTRSSDIISSFLDSSAISVMKEFNCSSLVM